MASFFTYPFPDLEVVILLADGVAELQGRNNYSMLCRLKQNSNVSLADSLSVMDMLSKPLQ